MNPTTLSVSLFANPFDANDAEPTGTDVGSTSFASSEESDTLFGDTLFPGFDRNDTPDGSFGSTGGSLFEDGGTQPSPWESPAGSLFADGDDAASSSAFDTAPNSLDAGDGPSSLFGGTDASDSLAFFPIFKRGDDEPEPAASPSAGGFTQEDLDSLSPAQLEEIRQITQQTPTLLYHGFTDTDRVVHTENDGESYINPDAAGADGRDPSIPALNRRGIDVDIEDFEQNMQYVLDNGGNFVTTRDIVQSVIDGTDLPPNPHIIRIDDGDQTTALAVAVVEKLKGSERYGEDRSIKLELGINPAAVGSAGARDIYAAEQFDVSGNENYHDGTSTGLDVHHRKVTWEELGDWVENDHVELSNHGYSHLFHHGEATIGRREREGLAPLTLGGNDVEVLEPEQVRNEIIGGETLLEERISDEIGEDYQVSTFIWPGGHSDNPASIPALEDSGHVIGLGTDNQSASGVPNDDFEGNYEPYVRGVFDDRDWPIESLPTITIGTEESSE